MAKQNRRPTENSNSCQSESLKDPNPLFRKGQRPPLAIIGVGCRFPGARNLEAYWRNILDGVSSITEMPPHRFNRERYYDPVPGAYGKSYSSIGGIIEETAFDWRLFNLPPKVVASTDITQLWALEVAKETFEHAGMDPFHIASINAGVILGHAKGSMLSGDMAFGTAIEGLLTALDKTEWYRQLPADQRMRVRRHAIDSVHGRYPARTEDGGPGTITSAVAGLITTVFGLTGRHMVVDAACASSLAAVDVGARALWDNRLDLALVGGVSYSQELSVIMFAQSRALSGDGSFPFDERANGFVSSDGVGMVLLKRLDEALRDGNPIYGLLRGVGGSCDGKGKALWAPRREGQVVAIARAYEKCDVDPATIGLVEAHGTSTELGDATEVEALTEFFGPHIDKKMSVPIGSVKGNIGHTREAAGIAGMIKAIMALHTKRIPPSINYKTPNKKIRWEETPFHHSGAVKSWEAPAGGVPRRAVVDAFGIGGLNYHVILEEAAAAAVQDTGTEAVRVSSVSEPAPIAIVGVGAKLPGASDILKFYRMLRDGRDAVTRVTDERWRSDIYYEPGDRHTYRTYCNVGGFVSDYKPDWQRFKMPPKLVESNDPLQFMLLEAAVDALSDAGYEKKPYDRRRVSVIIGSVFGSDFALQLALALRAPEVSDEVKQALRAEGVPESKLEQHLKEFEEQLRAMMPRINEDSSGSFSSSTLASRIAKTLDLMGPTFAVDAACASSLAAAEIAVESLRAGDCDMVICGGGDRAMRVQRFEGYCQFYSLSRSGRCAPFDEKADGFLPGEGAGVLVLKRLSDARRDGDKVYAVIRGVGSSSDGERKSLHRPSVRGLARAMQRAYADAGLSPDPVTYVECHGAGTPVGDATEAGAIREVFYADGRTQPVTLGSVKANVGHTQGAAGAAALIKTALSIYHGELLPTPHFSAPAPGNEFGRRLRVSTQREPFPSSDGRRTAGVSSMGLAGINYHFVIDSDAEPQPFHEAHRSRVDDLVAQAFACKVITLHAADAEALARSARAWEGKADALFATGTDGASGVFMVAIAAESAAGLARQLGLIAAQLCNPAARTLLESQGIFTTVREIGASAKVCLLFPGQGAQYPGMLKELAALRPEAREVLREFDAQLMAEGRPSLSEVLWGDAGLLSVDLFYTQAAVLAGDLMGFAVAQALGLRADVVTGHSYGDYPAMVAAGVLTRAEALRVTGLRCESIERAGDKQGAMASVFTDRSTVARILAGVSGYVMPSNINSPQQVVISGEAAAVEAAIKRFAEHGIEGRKLPVPGAFHSGLMAGAAREFEKALTGVALGRASTPLLSSVGAVRRSDPEDLRAALVAQLTEPVDFITQIERAYADGVRLFIEVGPGQILSKLTKEILGERPAILAALDDKKRPGAFPLAKAQAAIAAFKSSIRAEGNGHYTAAAPVIVSPTKTTKPGSDKTPSALGAAAGLFTPEQWQFLSSQPQFESFWAIIRPPLAGMAADMYRRFRAAGSAPRVEPPPATAPVVETVADPEEVRRYIIEQVCHFTGYPPEIIDFDQDLEADLGVDTVKQAQVFGKLREEYNLATDDQLALRDFPTLRHVMDYVLKKRAFRPAVGQSTDPPPALPAPAAMPAEFSALFGLGLGAPSEPPAPGVMKFFDATTRRGHESFAHLPPKVRAKLAAAAPAKAPEPKPHSNGTATTTNGTHAPAPAPPKSANGNGAMAKEAAVSVEAITDYILTVISEQTGYPREILDLDQDLEADLGIDTVKQAQALGKVREHFNLRTDDALSLRDFPTLRHIIDYVARQCDGDRPIPVNAPSMTAMAPPAAVKVAPETGAVPDVKETVVRLFCEATGYPPEIMDLDQDLEADLGIDTVKQAQTFGKLREIYNLKTDDTLSLRDFPTLNHIIGYVRAQITEKNGAPAVLALAVDERNGTLRTDAPATPAPVVAATPRPMAGPSTDLQIIRLHGSPYEIGRRHGQALPGAIRHILESYEKFIKPDGVKNEVLQEALSEPERYFDEIALEEIRGVVDGAGLPHRYVLAYNLDSAIFGEYTVGCTQFVRRQSDGLRHAVNEDSPLALYLGTALTRVMQVRKPSGKIPSIFFSLAGQIAGLAGINARSLSVTSSILIDRARAEHREGHVHAILVRRILEEASDVRQARSIAESFPRTGAWALTVSDGLNGEVVYMEYDGRTFHAETVEEGFQTTNHARRLPATATVPEHSQHRLARIRQLLEQAPALDTLALARMMRDRFDGGRGREVARPTMNTVRRVDNMMTLVMDPAHRHFTVSNGWRPDGTDPDLLSFDADTLWSEDGPGGHLTHAGTAFEIRDIPVATGKQNGHTPERSVRADVMRRHVIRAVPEPLATSNRSGSYRPPRIVLIGKDAVAEALAAAWTARGTEVLRLTEADDAKTAVRVLQGWMQGETIPDLCLTTGYAAERREPPTQSHPEYWQSVRGRRVETPFRCLQAWTTRLRQAGAGQRATLSAVTSLGGAFGFDNPAGVRAEGGPLVGLLKAVRREFDPLHVKVLDVSVTEPIASVVKHFLEELDSGDHRLEIGLLQGTRHVLRMMPRDVRPDPQAHAGEVKNWLITGGARGVTAAIAEGLACEFRPHLHLVGTTPLADNAAELAAKSETEMAQMKQDLLGRLKVERRSVTPVEWEAAWKPIAKSAEIARTLARLEAAGATVRYHVCDVADPTALADLLAHVREVSGPIGGVVHGAGTEQAKPFDRKADAMVAATLTPKIDGTRHLLHLLEADRPRYFVGFSSISGRFGGHGQTDYSMANEGMAKLIAEYRAAHPECHALAISWPAWGEIGMAARPESKTFLEAGGQKFMPPDEGVRHFLRELVSNNSEAEITIVERVDALDMDHILPKPETWPSYDRLAEAAGKTALLDAATPGPSEGVRTEVRLDPAQDAFLTEHRLGPTPILPAVVGCEIMAETAALANPSARLIGLKDVAIHTALKFPAPRPAQAIGMATAEAGGVQLRLAAGFYNREGWLIEPERKLFTATAWYEHEAGPAPTIRRVTPQVEPIEFQYPAAFDTDPKSRMVFHGPPLRGLRRVYIQPGDDHLAEIDAPCTEGLRAGTTMSQWRLAVPALDCCLQACGVVARLKLGVMGLPDGFGALRFGRLPQPDEPLRLFIHFRRYAENRLHFDFELVGRNGEPIVHAHNYQSHTFADGSAKAARR